MFRKLNWLPKPWIRKRRYISPKQLEFVLLEDRCTPATFVVNSTADTGAGTLRNQIAAANAAAGADIIVFDAAVFTSAKTITLTTGEIAITSDVTIDGPDQPLSISGNSSSRIFNINGAGTMVVGIQDVTLTKGITAGVNDGGAVFIQDENVTLTNCTLTANTSASEGGALHVEAGGTLTISACTFSSNSAAATGGAIQFFSTPTVTISNSTFSGNTANGGGALNMPQGGSLTISGCTLNSNSAIAGQGGAMFLSGTLTTASLRNSTFHGNSCSGDGGGVAISSPAATTLTVHNSTFSLNNAGSDGGAIARTGGASTITLVSTIVFGNNAVSANDNLFSAGTVNATLCVIGNTTGVTTFNGDSFTNSNLGVNPGLGSLANNGGPTKTMAITAGSIAENAGSNVLGLTTDQRGTGYFRVRGGQADIGAFEVPDDFIVTNTNNSGTGSLRQAVLDANNAVGIDTIVFDASIFTSAKTITLTTGELLVTEQVTIAGPAQPLTISGNNASRIFHAENASDVATLNISKMTITAGKATGADGGAILSTENLLLTDVNVTNSSAGDKGGAIRLSGSGSFTMTNCSITGNTAVTGGGIAQDGGFSSSHKFGTVSGNVATGSGGGIALLGATPFALTHFTVSGNTAATGGGIAWTVNSNNNSINNCTFTGNVATGGNGGGAYVKTGTTNFISTIVSGNSGAGGPDIVSPGTTNVNNSAIGNTTGFTITGANNVIGANLLLGPLASNGGTLLTHLPAINSPVLSKGSNPTGATTDARGSGFPRLRGVGVDIGAVEVSQLEVLNTSASGAGSLSQAVLDANAATGADTITFDATAFAAAKTIIPAAELTVTNDLNIVGPAEPVTISGNLAHRILQTTGGDMFEFSNLKFVLGSSTSNGGAVLFNSAAAELVGFINCTFSFNQATTTGGAVAAGFDRLTFIDCTASSNSSLQGGFVNMIGAGRISLLRTTVSNNDATSASGGGIAFSVAGSGLSIIDSTFSGNSASVNGGAIMLTGTPDASGYTVRNSTLSANTAGSFGGGIAWNNTTGTLTIQNSTITLNSSNVAAGGGGISVINVNAGAILSLESTIVSGNINAGAPDVDNPNTTNQKASAVGSNLGYAKTDLGGNLAFGASLLLGPLASNGGPTLNHLPGAGSPLINAGSNPASLTVDQRGFPRSLSGAPDIGSTEFHNTVVRNTNDSGIDSLRQILTDTNMSPGSQTITFDPTVFATAKTIALTTGPLIVSDDTTISGPDVGVTLSGSKASRVMTIGNADTLTVSLANLTIRDGVAGVGVLYGAGIVASDDVVTLTNCTFTDNSALSGAGGIAVVGTGLPSASLTVNNSSFLNNHGEGLSITANTIDLNVNGSTFSGNFGTGTGGAIAAVNPGTVTITNSTITGNTADDGAGLFLLHTASLTIRNSTISNNTASGIGGGIRRLTPGSTTIISSIVSGNTAPSGPDISIAGTVSATTSLIGSTSGVTTFTGDAFTNASLGIDPQLGALANNGGPTQTRLPSMTSPALNSGSNPASLAADQRGFNRVSGSAIDIGAIEVQQAVVTNTNNSGVGSLRQAIITANAFPSPEAIVTFDPATFATAKTITLTTGELPVTHSMSILGPAVGVTVSGNNASRIFNINGAGTLNAVLSDLTLTKGFSNASGSAMTIADENVTLTRMSISGNSGTTNNGGGLAITGGNLIIDSCTISGNTAVSAGGMVLYGIGSLLLRNSTISGNSVSNIGGGIARDAAANFAITIQNSTITANTAATNAGGLRLLGTGAVTITSSIVSGNQPVNDIAGGSALVTFSALGVISGFTLSGGSGNNLANNINLKLGVLGNNGGGTLTHLPADDSPVFNVGSNPAALATDQRGVLRALSGAADIGAVEIRKFVVTNTNNSGAGSLRQNVLDANVMGGADTITFDPAVFATKKTITLTSGDMIIAESLTITGPASGVTISGNNSSRIAEVQGGATTTLTLSNAMLTAGIANSGGAVLADGALLNFDNVTLSGNTATAGPGGAISIINDGGLQGANLTFQNNKATGVGGALAVQGLTDNGGALLSNSIFSGNSSFATGGAAYVESFFQVFSLNVSGNSAALGGGAFHVNETYSEILTPAFIANSTVADNTATGGDGGAFLITNLEVFDQFSIVNSTVTGNSTSGKGGAVANASSGGTLYIASSIFQGNTAVSGQDVSSTPTVTAKSSLISSNAGMTSFAPDSFTLAKLGVDPLLGPLQSNGGLGLTRMPANTSPAVANGLNAGFLPSTDQRGAGFPRVRGAIDIGAVETTVLIVTNTNDSGAGSLRQAVLDANAVAGNDTILFDPTVFATAKTITLTTGQMIITESLSVTGPAVGVTVSGNNSSRIFVTTGGDTFTFSNLTLTKGFASGINGAAVEMNSPLSETLTLTNCTFTGNLASFGGAIHGINDSVTLIDCVATGNSATKFGGFIDIAGSGTVTITRTHIGNNNATFGGGAISLGDKCTLVIDDSSLTGNSAANGGAIDASLNGIGTALTLRNSTMSGNTASVDGGAIYLAKSLSSPIIQNTTLTLNVAAGKGGAIRLVDGSQPLTVSSSIVFGNSAISGPDFHAATVNATVSLVGSKSGVTTFSGDSFTNANIGVNPLLGTLANNGGTTLTHVPANNSPAFNAGSNPAGLTLDQRGLLRTIGSLTDIGAVEIRNLVVTNTNDAGPGSLRQNVLEANALSGADTITFDPTAFATAKTIALASGPLTITGDATVTGPTVGVTLSGNNASRVIDIDGGAPSIAVQLSDLTVANGRSSNGAGLSFSNDTVTITRCYIVSNSASVDGGGIAGLTTSGNLTVIDSTIADNKATFEGAGILMGGLNSTLSIIGSTISGNSAGDTGGGVFQFEAGSLIVRNSTVSGNTAKSGGGIGLSGIVNASVIVQNTTLTKNSATVGGAFFRPAGGTTLIESSILFGNTGGGAPELSAPGTVTANTSLIGSKAGVATFTGDAFTNANISVNPQLGTLANNGGPTLTHMPAVNSRAVNNGSNPAALTVDQRGFTRVVGGAIDIGAVETRSFLVTNTNDSGAGSLRQAILDTNGFAGVDVIAFDATVFATAKTISALTPLPAITDAVVLQGTGANLLTIRRDPSAAAFRVLTINPSTIAASIADVTLSGGLSTTNGGGVSSTATTLTMDRTIVSGNVATTDGGGVFLNGGTLTLRDSSITGNSAGNDGGGLRTTGAGLTFERSTLATNIATNRGGGVQFGGSLPVVILNSTVSGNTANAGGGLDVNTFTNKASILNSTITANRAVTSGGSGGGVLVGAGSATIEILGSIVSGNIASFFSDVTNGSTLSIGNSAIGSGTSLTFTNLGGNLPFGANVRLAPLANNGGFTPTHALQYGSPAIDAGSNPAAIAVDQRGQPRTVLNAIDMGAYEFDGVNVVVNGGATQRSRITSITLTMPAPVVASTFTGFGNITLTRTATTAQGVDGTVVRTAATGANGRINVSPSVGSSATYTLTFDNGNGSPITAGVENGSLADGRWQMSIPLLGFNSTLNDTHLRRLFGDDNNDGTVNATDFAAFGNFFGATTNDQRFDFDNNGTINALDLAEFGNRFGVTL